MAKSSPTNVCRRALNNGKLTCKGKDLLTEYQTWSKKLRITDVTNRFLDRKSIKTAIRKNTEKDIKALVQSRPKIYNHKTSTKQVLPGYFKN